MESISLVGIKAKGAELELELLDNYEISLGVNDINVIPDSQAKLSWNWN